MRSQFSYLFLLYVLYCGHSALATSLPETRYAPHDDAPISIPSNLKLEQVIMLGRHGNRAPDAEVSDHLINPSIV